MDSYATSSQAAAAALQRGSNVPAEGGRSHRGRQRPSAGSGDDSDEHMDDIGSDNSSGQGDGLSGLEAALSGSGDPADVRATLGNVASGLAEQLSSITEEMNKIRQELYGESGIGGIAKELEKLKSVGLGGLLDDGALEDMLGKGGGGSSSTRSGRTDSSSSSSSSSSKGPRGGSDRSSECSSSKSDDKARRRRTPEEHDKELDDLRQRLLARRGHSGQGQSGQVSSKPSVTIWEKLMLLAIVLICLYVGSPFFRMAVKRSVSSLIYGELLDEEGQPEEEVDDW